MRYSKGHPKYFDYLWEDLHKIDNQYYIMVKNDDKYTREYITGVVKANDYYATFKNGYQEGLTRVYHENGKRQSIKLYESGKLHGLYSSYYDNGQLESTGEYKRDIKKGIWKEYDSEGNIVKKINHDYPTGKVKEFYKNGNLKSVHSLDNYDFGDLRPNESFYENGNRKVLKWRGGQFQVFWYPNGSIKQIGNRGEACDDIYLTEAKKELGDRANTIDVKKLAEKKDYEGRWGDPLLIEFYESGKIKFESIGSIRREWYENGNLKSVWWPNNLIIKEWFQNKPADWSDNSIVKKKSEIKAIAETSYDFKINIPSSQNTFIREYYESGVVKLEKYYFSGMLQCRIEFYSDRSIKSIGGFYKYLNDSNTEFIFHPYIEFYQNRRIKSLNHFNLERRWNEEGHLMYCKEPDYNSMFSKEWDDQGTEVNS